MQVLYFLLWNGLFNSGIFSFSHFPILKVFKYQIILFVGFLVYTKQQHFYLTHCILYLPCHLRVWSYLPRSDLLLRTFLSIHSYVINNLLVLQENVYFPKRRHLYLTCSIAGKISLVHYIAIQHSAYHTWFFNWPKQKYQQSCLRHLLSVRMGHTLTPNELSGIRKGNLQYTRHSCYRLTTDKPFKFNWHHQLPIK